MARANGKEEGWSRDYCVCVLRTGWVFLIGKGCKRVQREREWGKGERGEKGGKERVKERGERVRGWKGGERGVRERGVRE